MIYPYNAKNRHLWDQQKLKVQIFVPGNTRAIAYCDGTDEDIEELMAKAEDEGAEPPPLSRRYLKTGREIWTMGEEQPADYEEED
jgi:hypothetical protein